MESGLRGLLDQVTSGNVGSQVVEQAANDHLQSMDGSQLVQHVQDAANNAQQRGQTDVAQQLLGLIQRHGSQPESLKDELVSLIKSQPQLLEHFAPPFAQGILGRLGV